jgi:spore coat polysaccharide biosynthesis protein SpsF
MPVRGEARTALFLLARTRSTRLPGKSLLPLRGRPVIEHQIERLRPARVTVFALATTELPEDDPLAAIAERSGIACFRGATHDVVKRLADAATRYDVDVAACLGGDDVFCEPELVDAVIAEHARTGADFVTIADVPFGTTPFGVTAAGLRRVLDIKDGEFTDGWERYFTDTGLFQTRALRLADPALDHPHLRLDLDYPEDFALIEAIYDRLYDGAGQPPLRAVVDLLTRREPNLAQLNRSAHEEWQRTRAAAPLNLRRG